jgi:thiamine biosynthesis lipoprotein
MELDFGGLAKEYAADRAAAALCGMAARHGLVDLGGDIAIVGPHPSGSPWRIGVTSFSNPQEAIATLLIRDGAVATSGDYERFIEIDGRRFSHVIDPKTGMPVEGLASVTVVADTCLAAGIAATIGLLKATDGPTWLSRSGLEHLYLDRAGDVSGSIRLD